MPINTVCPECQASYQLADRQAGKKVRCKNCQTVFVAAEASSRRTAVRGDGGPSSQTRTKPSTMTARRDDAGRSVEKKSALPWVLGGVAVVFGLLLLLCGALITYLMMSGKPAEVAKNVPTPPVQVNAPPPPPDRPFNQPAVPPPPAPPQADNQPIQGQPVVQPPKPAPPAKPADPPPNAVEDNKRPHAERGNEGRAKLENEERGANNGRLSEKGRERVKHATVFLRVKMADGTTASGSGFFGCKEARNIVLTNAHVVGMLSPESARPLDVEVVVNSGEANEWKTKARVLGVDRLSDLAVLDIGTPPQPVPEPLPVKAASGLHELDEVYVFGFPFGEQLGKEITIRPASVSALRRNKSGILQRVQVNGGMDPGNSGGPVVDNSGVVVGVAVSGIPGRQINFAIPGERVHAILDGRISDLAVHQPYFTDNNKVAVPVVLDMIDPRNLIKEVGLEVWTGEKPADAKSGQRPPATTPPPAQAGDSSRSYYKLRYVAPEGKAEIVLPELPPDKVYWQQPKWINAKGETHWAAANPIRLPSAPVRRQPAKLALHYNAGAKRLIDLNIENIFRVSEQSDDGSETFRIHTAAKLTEKVFSTGPGGTILNLRYKFAPSRDLVLPDGRSIPNPTLEHFKNDLPRLITSMVQLDRLGNITLQSIDDRPLRQLALTNPKQVEEVKEFHALIQQGLESLSVSLPPGGTAKPLESWKGERQLPIDTPGKIDSGKLEVTFTYLGTRKRDGREEAVISMDGQVRGKDDAIGGRANGQILVDLNNGQTILAETTVKLQLKALLNRPGEAPRELRVIDTMKFRMQRKM